MWFASPPSASVFSRFFLTKFCRQWERNFVPSTSHRTRFYVFAPNGSRTANICRANTRDYLLSFWNSSRRREKGKRNSASTWLTFLTADPLVFLHPALRSANRPYYVAIQKQQHDVFTAMTRSWREHRRYVSEALPVSAIWLISTQRDEEGREELDKRSRRSSIGFRSGTLHIRTETVDKR